MNEQELRAKLAQVRQMYPWAANFDDAILLHTIQKYPLLFADMGPVPWFEWGIDPVTRSITKFSQVVTPTNLVLIFALALGFFLFLQKR